MTRAISATLALLIAVGLVVVMAEGTHVMSKEPRFPQMRQHKKLEHIPIQPNRDVLWKNQTSRNKK